MTRNTRTGSLSRAVLTGAGSGVIASVVMAMYAMVAAWVKGTGFFTQMYHIASLWASQNSMMASMKDAVGGSDFHVVLGTAVLGAVIHMMTGAMFGAVFGLIVSRLHLGIAALAGIGVVYGLFVFLFSTYLGLPFAAAVFGSGDQIKNMAEMAGRGTFLVEHLLFGLSLGVLAGMAPAKTAVVPADAPTH